MTGRRRGSPRVDVFETRLGHSFRDRSRLEAAWVHRSAANERGHRTRHGSTAGRHSAGDGRAQTANNERLEFLGDAVLGLVAAEWLYRKHPGLPEGELARRKSALVSAEALGIYAREIGLGDYLVIGQGEEASGGRDKTSLLADSLEAVFAAVFLDSGLRASRRVIQRFLEAASRSLDLTGPDPKSALQERIQAQGLETPIYRVTAESGPDHAKTFTVEVVIEGKVASRGSGRSKKSAETEAARHALRELEAESRRG